MRSEFEQRRETLIQARAEFASHWTVMVSKEAISVSPSLPVLVSKMTSTSAFAKVEAVQGLEIWSSHSAKWFNLQPRRLAGQLLCSGVCDASVLGQLLCQCLRRRGVLRIGFHSDLRT